MPLDCLLHFRPVHLSVLAPPGKTAPPVADRLPVEALQSFEVTGQSVVVEMAAENRIYALRLPLQLPVRLRINTLTVTVFDEVAHRCVWFRFPHWHVSFPLRPSLRGHYPLDRYYDVV